MKQISKAMAQKLEKKAKMYFATMPKSKLDITYTYIVLEIKQKTWTHLHHTIKCQQPTLKMNKNVGITQKLIGT